MNFSLTNSLETSGSGGIRCGSDEFRILRPLAKKQTVIEG